MSLCRRSLQQWDFRSSDRVDSFIANSANIAAKIRKLYGREAAVIHPPVDTKRFFLRDKQESYYLIVSALVPYKKIHLAIEAFNRLKLPLKIAGDGPLRKELVQTAGPTIDFLGWVDDQALPELYASCQALIFPGEEDFGIVPLEAQASGRPVIAYGSGGALETVVPWRFEDGRFASGIAPTGIFFREPTPESLIQAVGFFQLKQHEFRPSQIRDHASRFSRERFSAEIRSYIDARVRESQAEK
jgi:glycosyltransferase involved in cell wall biosynthesis